MTEPSIDIKDFRQPVVTSLGVILGFLLGFLGQWVQDEHFALKDGADYITLLGCVGGAVLLLLALFRMLSPGIPAPATMTFYRRTLQVYMAGVLLPLGSILLAALI